MNVRAEGAAERVLSDTAEEAEATQTDVAETQVEETIEKTDFPNSREGREIGAELGRDIFDSGRDTIASAIDSIRDKLTLRADGTPRGGIFSAIGSVIKLGRDTADAVYGINFGDGTRQEGIVDLPRMAKEDIHARGNVIADKIVGASEKVVGVARGFESYVFRRIAESVTEGIHTANSESVAAAEAKTAEAAIAETEEARRQAESAAEEIVTNAELAEQSRIEKYREQSIEDKWTQWENHLQKMGAMKNGKVDRLKVQDTSLTEKQISELEKRATKKTIDRIKGLGPIEDIPERSAYVENAEAMEAKRKKAEKLAKESKSLAATILEVLGLTEQNDRED